MSINLIGLSGYIGSGKSTVGEIIQYLTTHPNSLNKTDYGKNRSFNSFKIDVGCGSEPEWKIKGFSVKLKEIASILTGIPAYKFEDQEFKSSYLNEEWNTVVQCVETGKREGEKTGYMVKFQKMTARTFLQKLGTEAIRDVIHENAWVNALFADYKFLSEEHNTMDFFKMPKWIITDCRFPNEAQAIKDKGGIVVRVNRMKAWTLEEVPYLHPSEISLDDWKFDWEINNSGPIDDLIEKVREMLVHFKIIEYGEKKEEEK